MKSKIPIILLNFTGVYDLEAFASNKNIIHVDCRGMKGVDCYCDEERAGRSCIADLLLFQPRLFISSIPVISITLRNIGYPNSMSLSP